MRKKKGWDAVVLSEGDMEYRRPSRPSGPADHQLQPLQITAPVPFNIRAAGEVRPHRSLCIARRPDSAESQQYRLLRYRLKESSDPRLIGISSPMQGEGKTTVAANLALALAEGRRVKIALLDLNLRSPALANMFGLSVPGSVAEQLRIKRGNPGAYWEVLELGRRLHLLAGNIAVENPAPLLNSSELAFLLQDLAEYYDFVVVDLPAVLMAADVKSIQSEMDAVVLVCRAGFTTKSAISQAVDQLGAGKIHGALMLDVNKRYLPA